MSTINLARSFSRQGINLLRFSREEVSSSAAASRLDALIFRGAVLVSILGFSVSMFSISQLQDTRNSRRNKTK